MHPPAHQNHGVSLGTAGADQQRAIRPAILSCGMQVNKAKAAASLVHEGTHSTFAVWAVATSFRKIPGNISAMRNSNLQNRSPAPNIPARCIPKSCRTIPAHAPSAA